MTQKLLGHDKFTWRQNDVKIVPFSAPGISKTPMPTLPKINFIHATLDAEPGLEVRSSGWFAAQMRSVDTVQNVKVWVRLVKTYHKHLTMKNLTWVEWEYQVMHVRNFAQRWTFDQPQAMWHLQSTRTQTGNLLWSYSQERLNRAWMKPGHVEEVVQ